VGGPLSQPGYVNNVSYGFLTICLTYLI
jgi:hypothetical protein